MPPAPTWFVNLHNPQTRGAHHVDFLEFMRFDGIKEPEAFRQVGPGHVPT
jgi:hypothetical protein